MFTQVDYPLIASTCNMFRALTDIYYNYQSIESMILYFASNPYNMTEVAGPGAWNDPDQVRTGDGTARYFSVLYGSKIGAG